ncbi:MAG: QueT transporter family protein, partial [Firmicutes bacterium]|nr:QueT transporter family protein [Bacillota bacterium]
IATLIGAVGTYLLRKKSMYLAPVPPIVSNTVIVPFVLKYAYQVPLPIPLMMLTVGVGEVISCGVLGVLLGKLLKKHEGAIFGERSGDIE